jgi:hypothetical protein
MLPEAVECSAMKRKDDDQARDTFGRNTTNHARPQASGGDAVCRENQTQKPTLTVAVTARGDP